MFDHLSGREQREARILLERIKFNIDLLAKVSGITFELKDPAPTKAKPNKAAEKEGE